MTASKQQCLLLLLFVPEAEINNTSSIYVVPVSCPPPRFLGTTVDTYEVRITCALDLV